MSTLSRRRPPLWCDATPCSGILCLGRVDPGTPSYGHYLKNKNKPWEKDDEQTTRRSGIWRHPINNSPNISVVLIDLFIYSLSCRQLCEACSNNSGSTFSLLNQQPGARPSSHPKVEEIQRRRWTNNEAIEAHSQEKPATRSVLSGWGVYSCTRNDTRYHKGLYLSASHGLHEAKPGKIDMVHDSWCPVCVCRKKQRKKHWIPTDCHHFLNWNGHSGRNSGIRCIYVV